MFEPISSTVPAPARSHRDQVALDLRELADWLGIESALPLPRTVTIRSHVLLDNDVDGIAELHRLAAILGVEPIRTDDGHHIASRTIGAVTYQLVYIERQRMRDHDAFMAARDAREAARRAGAVSEDEPRCPDPECGESLDEIASGAVGHCGRSCALLDEETARVEEDAAERRSVEAEQLAEVEAERDEEPTEYVGVSGNRYELRELIGVFDESPCDAPAGTASIADGRCRCIVCGRCGHHTGNGHQGHHWGFCQVTKTVREPHFCCPDDCELETAGAVSE